MFPGVYGFHWSAGHIIFLGIFFSVLLVIASTVSLAVFRGVRDFRASRQEAIRWESDFHELSAADRVCRHQLNGELKERACPNGFDCRKCETHPKLVEKFSVPKAAAEEETVFGFRVPLDRMYHRGHTWVRSEPDGTVTIGLDELGKRVLGRSAKLELPEPGTRVEVNGTAWRAGVRVLSPVDGEVVETGGPDADFYLRVKPVESPINTTHLLREGEVHPWMMRELERLQMLIPNAQLGATLADGGVLVDDMGKAFPDADWDTVSGRIFMEP